MTAACLVLSSSCAYDRQKELENEGKGQVCDVDRIIFLSLFIIQSVHHKTIRTIIYNKPTRCNSGSIVFIKNYKYALRVSDALCVHLQEHYKL